MIRLPAHGSAIGLAILLSCGGALSQQSSVGHPNAEIDRYYQANSSTIGDLQKRATDSSAAVSNRIEALRRLTLEFRHAALPVAASLITDPAEGVAVAAARVLSASLAMADHPISTGHSDHKNSALGFMEAQHGVAREALRRAVVDPRPTIRDVAASTLASLSDEVALQRIDEAAGKGLYTDTEAVNYLGLANPDKAAGRMEKYLEKGSNQAQAAAVTYLGALPRYQTQIRQRVLDNQTASPLAQAAAVRSLSQYDPQFLNYAPRLLNNSQLAPQAFDEVVQGYVARTQSTLDLDKVQDITRAIENYSKQRPEADLSGVRRQLQGLRGSPN